MTIHIMPRGHWAVTEDSLHEVLQLSRMAETSVENKGLMGLSHYDDEDDDEEELSRLLTISGNTAVVNIAGSLTNNASYWNRYFGVTGYPEIREALIQAANDESVENILLQVDSGGGAVKGVFDLAEFIKKIDTLIKPIETINTGMMASAAYLLGSQARKVHATEMSQTGSIGVIMVHMEYTEMFKERGIKVNVIRAGKYKALVNPYEKLTPEAEAGLQKEADYIHGKFIEVVAEGREMSESVVKEKMADGKVYYTEDALELGLVDNISNIDKLVAELNERQREDPRSFITQAGDLGAPSPELSSNGDNTMAKKKEKLSEENQAKLASGLPIEGLDTSDDNSDGQLDAEAEAKAAEEAQAKLDAEAKVAADAKAKLEAESGEQGSTTELTTFLKDQNKTLSADKAEMTLELSQVKAELATLQASTDGLEKIVVEACSRLAVPMGQAGTDFSHLNGNALVEAYGNLNTSFCKRFPVGGKVNIEADPEQNKTQTTNRAKHVDAAKV